MATKDSIAVGDEVWVSGGTIEWIGVVVRRNPKTVTVRIGSGEPERYPYSVVTPATMPETLRDVLP